jgi:hypothetical protein
MPDALIRGAALDIRHLGFGDNSGLQNVAEFLAAMCAIWGLRELGRQGLRVNGRVPDRIILEGDSTSALAWAKEGRVKSNQVTNAAMVFVLLGVASGIQELKAIHVPAESNGRADYMSRLHELDKSMAGLAEKYPDLADMKMLPLKVEGILQMAASGSQLESGEQFLDLWSRLRAHL